MRNFNWPLFWKWIIPAIVVSLICGFFIGSSILIIADVGVWMIFGIMVFVAIAWVVDTAYQTKPGTAEPQKLNYVVRPTSVVRVLRTKPGKKGIIVFMRQDGDDTIRRGILLQGTKIPDKGLNRIGYNFEFNPCESHEVIKKPVK